VTTTRVAVESPRWRRIGAQRDVLGECPLWDERAQCLWWIDIRAPALRCARDCGHEDNDSDDHVGDGDVRSWPLPEMVGSIALVDDGRLLLALSSSLVLFDPASGESEPIASPRFADPDHRFNDGRCDRQGRFWVGSMNNVTRAPEGTLYRLIGRGDLEPVAGGLCIPNSLAFSPDGATMLVADSLHYSIEACDFDGVSGAIGVRRTLAVTEPPAFPDGSAIDAEGFLWNAEFNGGRIVRYAPDGRIDRVLATPVPRPTCCAFGGPELRTLYVTSASQQMDAAALAAMPLAGALLALDDVGVRGLPESRFVLNPA
jgi:sugar lactone lactonase YvrE